ncbi:DUF1120 domain-containing protein [Buttiauxella agrestis]|uniref:Beta-fimbriae major subunit n=1 Tax=Buttiauxella agrestis ATCC 33320 TaxID=1006004 RepID=A0A085FYX4_9ENTR|nr:DUF1120 domain-containing protein [Buttiauxella agrestis]KFC76669.1 hypothetical protein GBAG_4389 [Buttiauxella agrestis ATCC 33320]
MLKNIKLKFCALAILTCTSQLVMAADSTDVHVLGSIAPAACTPILSGGGVVDYGTIKTNALAATDYTTLDVKTVDLSITCSSPTQIGIKAINGRMGSLAGGTEGVGGGSNPPVALSVSNHVVGLGLEGDAKIGGYGIGYGVPMLDGVAVSNVWRNSASTSWSNSASPNLYGTGAEIITSWGNNALPVAFTTMTVPVKVQAYINKASELDLSKQVKMDGLTTLEMVYL